MWLGSGWNHLAGRRQLWKQIMIPNCVIEPGVEIQPV